jgi:hypothetical protein
MDEHRIELFVFPDGTEVEIIVFERPRGPYEAGPRASSGRACPRGPLVAEAHSAEQAARADDPEAPVHICPLCRGELVHPVSWERTGERSWALRLRCPDCETERAVTVGRAAVEDFNRSLYYGHQELARAAQEMSRRNFEEEAARLVAALELDLILPMDF